MSDVLSLFTIYESPSDYPGEFVCRHWDVGAARSEPGPVVARGKTLDEVRGQIPPGLFRLPRDPRDDPKIVETYV